MSGWLSGLILRDAGVAGSSGWGTRL